MGDEERHADRSSRRQGRARARTAFRNCDEREMIANMTSELGKRGRAARCAGTVVLDPVLCKACGICVALCPHDVLEGVAGGPPRIARPEECTLCRACELHCPDFAIRIEAEGEEVLVAEEAID
jgi:NAD-dependent dihydropyrimidine dehydrogenase PreA subunit